MDTATDSVLNMVKCLKANNNTHRIANKANSEKKGSKSAVFSKVLASADKNIHKVQEFVIDCEAAGNTRAQSAKCIKHSLENLEQ